MGILADNYLDDLTKKSYVKEMEEQNKSKEHVGEAEANRMKGLLSICVSGITALYWSRAAALLMEMHSAHEIIAFCLTLFFLVGILFMVTGGIAATFPANAPCKMGFSGVGAWLALVFTLGSFHLATFELHKDPVYSIISFVICLLYMTTFWGIVAQDPVAVHIFAKFVVWGICKSLDIAHEIAPLGWLAKARDVIKPLTLAAYQLARDFLPDGPPFLPENFLTDVTKKDYEKDYHGKTKEEFEQSRVAEYLASCVSGLMGMHWSEAAAAVMALNVIHPDEAFLFVIYFTVALILMLTGVIAATFPSSCPCKMGFAGLGALQAVHFIVGTFLIAMLNMYIKPIYLWIFVSVSTTFIIIFWGIVVEDPVLVRVLAKFAIWSCSYMAYSLYRLGYNICSAAGTAWAYLVTPRQPNNATDPALQARLLANSQQSNVPPRGP